MFTTAVDIACTMGLFRAGTTELLGLAAARGFLSFKANLEFEAMLQFFGFTLAGFEISLVLLFHFFPHFLRLQPVGMDHCYKILCLLARFVQFAPIFSLNLTTLSSGFK